MKKERLYREFPLATRTTNLIWTLISTDHGLERWVADRVTEKNGVFTFTWGSPYGEHHTLEANIVARVAQSYVRLQWVDEDDPEAYWEMRIGRSELDGQVTLMVTDYTTPDDLDDLAELWNGNLERLHRSTGL